MQNIDVRFSASSNFAAVKADLAALQAQAAALGNVFKNSAYAKPPALVDPSAWRQSTRAVHEASNAYRNAASSSGLFNTQQIRATSEAEKYTKALQKQKLTLGDMRKHAGIMREVYRDQLRMQRMTVQYWGTDSAGRAITDIAVPKSVPKDLDTMRNRMGMFSVMAKSAGHEMVNLGKNIQWAGRQLTVGFSYPVALFGAAAGVMAYKVEDAFAKINKVYDVSAAAQTNEALRTKELNNLRTESMRTATAVAKKYGLTVEKTLGVEQELAATGLAGDKLQSATKEVSRISALGDIDPSQTTDMVVALQTAFRDTIKDADDLTNVLNFMNATSNATSLSLQDIAEATPRAASGLAQLGVTAEEMTILLASMKESGVDAAEGANALKSATTRILNPVKQARAIYAKYKIDIAGLAQASNGNLFKFLKTLGTVQQKIKGKNAEDTAYLRQQGIQALFGTYQNNRLTASLSNLADAYGGVQNQTAKAIELQNESSDSLALMAENSRKAMVENPAGKFKQEWAQFQIELAKVGQPFLAAAADILGVFTKIGKAFNGMDEWKKKAIMIAAVVLALAGPVIMIGGLVANLAGQFIKGVGAIGAFVTRFKIFTKEEVAAAKTTELVNTKLMTSKQVMQNLANEVRVLTAAYEKASQAARQFAFSASAPLATSAAAAGAAALVPPMRSQAGPFGPQLPINKATGMPMTSQLWQNYNSENAKRRPKGAPDGTGGQFRNEKERLATAQQMTREQRRHNQLKLQQNRMYREQQVTMENQRKIQDRISSSVSGTNVAMAAGGIAMATMMVSSNETANNISKWVLVGSIVVPAVISLAKWTASAAKSAWAYAAAQMAAGRATTAAAGGKAAVAGAGIRGLATGVAGLMGPIGWTLTAVAAIGVGLFAWKKHIDGVRNSAEALNRAQDKTQATLVDSTRKWAEATGEAYRNYVKYNAEGKKDATNKDAMARDELVAQYSKMKQKATVGGKTKSVGIEKAWSAMTSSQQDFTLERKAIELSQMGKSVDEIQMHLEAFMSAVGKSGYEAAETARQIIARIGNDPKNDVDWSQWIKNGFKAAEQAADDGNSSLRKSILNGMGQMFVDGFDTAKDKEAFLNYIKTVFNDGWNEAQGMLSQIVANSGGISAIGGTMGKSKATEDDINKLFGLDAASLRKMSFKDVDEYIKKIKSYMAMTTGGSANFKAIDELSAKLKNMVANERQFFGKAAQDSGMAESVDTMNDFMDEFIIKLKSAKTETEKFEAIFGDSFKQKLLQPIDGSPFAQAVEQWQIGGKISDEIIGQLNAGIAAIDPSKLPKWIIDFLHEIEKNNPEIDFKIDTKEVKRAVAETKASLGSLPSAVNIGLNIKGDQLGGIVKDSMSNVQNEMADSAMNRFNSGWDSRMSAVQNAQKSAQDAFDNRWEARKESVQKYYDGRVKMIEREIAAEERADTIRQRLFDKERERLQRMAELQNQNIDYNQAVSEGRLDDAAKIANDAAAKNMVNQMDSEQKSAEERTADRREAMEKRIEALNDRREKQLKRLEKIQERMRQHMERAQAAQIAGLERTRAAEEASLQDRLTMFKAYTARNQKDLQEWMKKVGLSYDDFGVGVRARGESWAKHFQTRLTYHLKLAGTQVANDNMWTDLGEEIGVKLINGLGFKNLPAFQKFINTGKMETRHEGGVIGSGGGSRKGVPNTYKGLHRSETLVRAQKGEYMVNKRDAAKNRPLLDAINSGTDVGSGGIGDGIGLTNIGIMRSTPEALGGPTALLMGAITAAFGKGLEKSYRNAYNNAKTPKAGTPGGSYSGAKFGNWSVEQMRNAATIASVGSGMGMSKRDLMIGIMTSIAESGLRNINYGDRDSVGLFQQRTSQGWGTVEQIMNPSYSSRKFFDALRGVKDRGKMDPWQAAQAVQRSAFADGSNYRQYWDDANAIFKKGLRNGITGSVQGPGLGYIAGSGGKHRPISGPVTSGLHGGNTAGNPPALDLAGPTGRPVYAVADGVITQSRDIAGPLASDRYKGDGPYGSFGKMIQLRTNSGDSILYAHLSRRSVDVGQQVKGGARIGLSGNTGNSSGPHLHFGATNGPSAWLRTGGTIRHDNTPAILHRDETVLTSSLTRKFRDNVASGGGDVYDIDIDLRGAYIKEDVDIEKAVNKAIDARETRRGRSRKVT